MTTSLDTDPWRARIRRADGLPVGAGVVVSSHHVLTCAHVVALALAAQAGGGRPQGHVSVDFPMVVGTRLLASVVDRGWIPQYADGRGDLALLELDGSVPQEVVPARLGRYRDVGNRDVRAYGHPAEMHDGVWARARLVGYGGPGGQMVQLDGQTVTGRRVERGFSGAGAHEELSGLVVGIVVAQDPTPAHRVAWMVPMEDVLRYLPIVGDPVEPAAPVGPAAPAGPAVPGPAAPAGPVVGGGSVPGPRGEPGPPWPRQPPRASSPGVSPGVSSPGGSSRSVPSGGVRPSSDLSSAERAALVQRVRAVPGMSEAAARTMYLDMLDRQLAAPLPVQRQSDDTLDVWAIVGALLDRPGSLREFVALLRDVHGEVPEVGDLEELVDRTVPDLLLDHGERGRLADLLTGVAWARVSTAYRYATRGHWLQRPLERGTTADAVRELELYGRTRGGPPPPLLAFVEHLAHALGGTTSAQLHRWIDAVAERLGVSRDDVALLCAATQEEGTGGGEAAVVVLVEPDPIDEEMFVLTVSQHVDGTESVVVRDDLPRTLSEVRRVVDDELRRAPELVDTDAELVVEVVLPRRLLGEPVEEWTFDRAVFPRPLGIHYPVVVRHLERLRAWRRYDTWRRRSRHLVEHGHRVDTATVWCLPAGPGVVERLRVYAELMRSDEIVGLALPFPPDAGTDGGPGEVDAAVEAGLPCVVWSRQPSDPAELCALVQSWVADDGPLSLPQRVRDHRRARQAEAVDGQPSPAVGLLYDLATRIPGGLEDPVRLRAPR